MIRYIILLLKSKLFEINALYKRFSESLGTTIITTIIKKKHSEKKQEDLLIMQLVIHSNRRDMMNAADATSINNQSASDALSKDFAQIKTKLNMKMNKIEKLYESKEKNLSKMMS